MRDTPPGEPAITISGVRLTTSEAMTVRVALGAFAMYLENENALGDDDHGHVMRDGYRARLRDIFALMANAPRRWTETMRDKPPLTMWTVYDHPTDYPNNYVARRFEVDANGPRPTDSIIITPDLEALRAMLAFELGLTCLTREPGDDPKIVEVWL